MKIFYLRDKKGFPVTCVASKIVHPLGGQPMVHFDFATHNPADRYSRERARKTAIARLEKYTIYGVYLRSEKGETRRGNSGRNRQTGGFSGGKRGCISLVAGGYGETVAR